MLLGEVAWCRYCGYCILMKDKSSSVGPHSIKQLMDEGDDVLLVGIGSGIVAAHLSSLTHHSKSRIFLVGVQSERHHKQIIKLMTKLGAKCKRIIVVRYNFHQLIQARRHACIQARIHAGTQESRHVHLAVRIWPGSIIISMNSWGRTHRRQRKNLTVISCHEASKQHNVNMTFVLLYKAFAIVNILNMTFVLLYKAFAIVNILLEYNMVMLHLFTKARVKLIGGNFLESNFSDARLREIKVILVLSNCTKSGVVNPVNFLVSEGDGLSYFAYRN